MSNGLTTLFSSPSGFLLLMVLFQKLSQKLLHFRCFRGIPGLNYDSLLSIHKQPRTFPHYIYYAVINPWSICPPLTTHWIRIPRRMNVSTPISIALAEDLVLSSVWWANGEPVIFLCSFRKYLAFVVVKTTQDCHFSGCTVRVGSEQGNQRHQHIIRLVQIV